MRYFLVNRKCSKSDMKICFIVGSVATPGGIQKVTSLIANKLSENNEVTVLSQDTNYEIKNSFNHLEERIKYKKLPLDFGIRNLKRAIKFINRYSSIFNNKNNWPILKYAYVNKGLRKWLINYCNTQNFDWVIGVNGDYSLLVASIADEISSKTIGWQHNATKILFYLKNQYFWHQDSMFKYFLPKLDYYFVLTPEDKIEVDRIFGLNSIVVPNPVSFISEEKSNMHNKKFIASGRFVEAKGFDILIDAFYKFSLKNSDWKLIILGDGKLKEKIKQQILNYHLQDRVIMPGMVRPVQRFLIDASIYILSSRWEGLSMATLEAQECGLPIISFDIQAVNKLIENGKNGIKIPMNTGSEGLSKVMYEIAQNYEMRKNMSKAATENAKKYYLNNIIKIWNTVIEENGKY